MLTSKEREENDMMIRKLIVGFALGLTLVTGVSGTAEAKSKAVTVTVNKADSATAKKVDTAMKKGKAVTLKVKGSKKSSKKLLIELQDAVAKVNVYGARFDLDNGSESCQGKGNVFQTYADLSYKQEGGYGCYTFDKSTCNAYKYFLKSVDKQYKRKVANVDWKKEYKEYLDSKSSDDNENMRHEKPAKVEAELTIIADEYMKREGLDASVYAEARSAAIESVAQLVSSNGDVGEDGEDYHDVIMNNISEYASCDIGNGHFGSDLLDYLTVQFDSVLTKVNKELEGNLEKAESFEEYVRGSVGNNLGDLYFGKITYLDTRYIWNTEIYGAINMKYDVKGLENNTCDWHLAKGTDEYRMKQLYKGTKGVCGDFAKVERACMDYCGIKSCYIANMAANHAVCVVSGSEFTGVSGREFRGDKIGDKSLVIFNCSKQAGRCWDVVNKKGYSRYFQFNFECNLRWDKLIKKAMGSDFPF